jgi:hypothetical protein
MDAEAIAKLRELLEKDPGLRDHVNYRIRIVGEFETGEPWPGYDDQDAEQIVAYYHACPPSVKPTLESIMQYELSRDPVNESKVVAIETLDKTQESHEKKAASAGVKM